MIEEYDEPVFERRPGGIIGAMRDWEAAQHRKLELLSDAEIAYGRAQPLPALAIRTGWTPPGPLLPGIRDMEDDVARLRRYGLRKPAS